MKNDVVEVTVKTVLPTANGFALFLSTPQKVFVMYVEESIGNTISLLIGSVKIDRPLTHELMKRIFLGFDIQLEHVVINRVEKGTFFARLILKMENELGTKLVELDARPSDSIVLALMHKRPIGVSKTVLGQVEDMSATLSNLLKQ